ncbi:hypothetical protein MYFR107205_30500 [Mycolicibacterium frederiksbergense]
MFGLTRFQCRLLGQGDCLDVGRLAAVGGVKLLGELGGARLDRRAPARPARHQFGRHSVDLAHRSLTASAGLVDEAHAEAGDHVGFEAGVVQLRGRHGDAVQRLTVQGQPPAHPIGVDVRHLVRHRDVGVQVGVTGAGIAVGERRGDESFGVDLGHPVGAGAGECCGILQPLQYVGDRRVVGGFDLFGHRQRGDGPERRHRFHR